MNFETHAVTVLVFEYCPSLYALRRHGLTDEFEYFAVNFTVTSVGVRQLCLRRIGARSQKKFENRCTKPLSFVSETS